MMKGNNNISLAGDDALGLGQTNAQKIFHDIYLGPSI